MQLITDIKMQKNKISKGQDRRNPYPGVLFILLILISACRNSLQVTGTENKQYIIGSGADTTADVIIMKLTGTYRDSLNQVMSEPLIFNKVAMIKELPEGNLGNFCSDLWYAAAVRYCKNQQLRQPDFAVFNHGGLRSALPAGMLTLRNIFELMPFENELVLCEIDKVHLDSLLNTIALKGGAPVANIQLRIHEGQVESAKYSASSDSSQKTVLVVTSDYLAGGNDNFTIFKTGTTRTTHLKLRDILIDELRVRGTLNDTLQIQKDGRITKY